MSAAAVAVILPGTGAKAELACSALRPCCHAGGGAAAGTAEAEGGGLIDWQAASASALTARASRASMGVSSCRCGLASAVRHRATRRIMVTAAPPPLALDHGQEVAARRTAAIGEHAVRSGPELEAIAGAQPVQVRALGEIEG